MYRDGPSSSLMQPDEQSPRRAVPGADPPLPAGELLHGGEVPGRGDY